MPPLFALSSSCCVGELRVPVGAHPRLVRGPRGWRVLEQPVRPGDEVLPVRAVRRGRRRAGARRARRRAGRCCTGGIFVGAVVVVHAEVLRAEQPEDRSGGDGGHVAALLVEPLGVALLRDAVADERRARRAQRDQLVRVHRHVAGVLAAEGRLGGAVLQEVAGHPVVFAGAGQVLDRLAEVAAVQLGAAFAGRADEHHGEARSRRPS